MLQRDHQEWMKWISLGDGNILEGVQETEKMQMNPSFSHSWAQPASDWFNTIRWGPSPFPEWPTTGSNGGQDLDGFLIVPGLIRPPGQSEPACVCYYPDDATFFRAMLSVMAENADGEKKLLFLLFSQDLFFFLNFFHHFEDRTLEFPVLNFGLLNHWIIGILLHWD